MYLTEFTIQRIKCFHDVSLKFPEKDGDYSGWNVILGGNGTGKSTLVQAMSVALIGPLVAQRLLISNSCRR
jgi:DNA repair exonuclease SbcCD ATPase subunit